MAVRDGRRWLRAAVDSALAQTFADFELLIIDDGSTDETPQILVEYRKRDRRVQVLTQGREGLAPALNRGLAAAGGSLIARLDADDVALPQRLQRQVDYLHAHPGVVLLGSWAQVIDEQGRVRHRRLRPPTDPPSLARLLPRTNPFVHSSVMFRAAAAREVGGYRAALEMAEDYDLWLRLCEHGQIAILPEILVHYRRHGGNVSKTKAVSQIFAARLARLSYAERQKTGRDPCSAPSSPPDWHAAEAGAFYADDARLCRVLELADPAIAGTTTPSSIDLEAVSRRLAELTHAEKKLAQSALINVLRGRRSVAGYSRGALLALIFRLDPARALRLIWGAL